MRDYYLRRPSNDIDVVVLGSGIEMATELKKTLGKGAYLSVFKNFGTAQVKYKDIELDSEQELYDKRRELIKRR